MYKHDIRVLCNSLSLSYMHLPLELRAYNVMQTLTEDIRIMEGESHTALLVYPKAQCQDVPTCI